MQDLDFSHRAAKHPNNISQGEPFDFAKERYTPTKEKHSTSLTVKNLIILFLAIASISFSLGITAGFFLRKAKMAEENLISYPDDMRSEYSTNSQKQAKPKVSPVAKSFTNAASSTAKNTILHHERPIQKPQLARFLIKIGVYSKVKAEELVRQFNQLPGLQSITAKPCQDIARNLPLNRLAFQVPVPSAQSSSGKEKALENVMLGCFANEHYAVSLLRRLWNSNIPEVRSAKLYEIKD